MGVLANGLGPFPEESVAGKGQVSGTWPHRFSNYLFRHHVEARGLERVLPDETHSVGFFSYAQAFLLWTSVNLAANNITLGMLASQIFGLGFRDAALCAVFGSLIGSIPVGYIAIWGPISGTRTMIFTRYTFGWWPSKLIIILNGIVLLGYALIDLVIAGQILSAVSRNGSLNLVVGIIIVAVICWVISTFGIKLFHIYERYAWFPQVIALAILYGVSSKDWDITSPSTGSTATLAGNRLSFFSLCLSAAITYAGLAADFFVYYSPKTSRVGLLSATVLGLVLSFTFALLVGIGLASGIAKNTGYAEAYAASQGALIAHGFSSLGNFGKFLSVIVWFSLVANTIGPSYSVGIDLQMLFKPFRRIPRFVWNTVGVVIYTVAALAGRNSLATIFTNFLAVMGYWVVVWFVITIEEQLFRRSFYDWTAWNEQSRLPIGLAALLAFLVGWAGAILCMAQHWYIGPIARLVGEYGADVSVSRVGSHANLEMGNYVGFAWAAIVYPPLRWLELRFIGR